MSAEEVMGLEKMADPTKATNIPQEVINLEDDKTQEKSNEGDTNANPHESQEGTIGIRKLPSQMSSRDTWLWSRRNPSQNFSESGDMTRLQEEGAVLIDDWENHIQNRRVPLKEKQEFMRKLYRLATDCRVLCGKWMVFPDAAIIDDLWNDICEANERKEKLGGCCKVGPNNPQTNQHLICIYCRDSNDTAKCKKVLHELNEICKKYKVEITASFKPDFLTYLGLYRGMEYERSIDKLKLAKVWALPELQEVLRVHKEESGRKRVDAMQILEGAITTKRI